jgi:hypothetical protein
MQILKCWLLATFIAGGSDILCAFLFAGFAGHGPLLVLRGVAAGPFGDHLLNGGSWASLVGLGVHFVIMSDVVAAFIALGVIWPSWREHAHLSGIIYGIMIYLVMYWVLLPIRYPDSFPQHDPLKIAKALFAHVFCIGLPIAWITRSFSASTIASKEGPSLPGHRP